MRDGLALGQGQAMCDVCARGRNRARCLWRAPGPREVGFGARVTFARDGDPVAVRVGSVSGKTYRLRWGRGPVMLVARSGNGGRT